MTLSAANSAQAHAGAVRLIFLTDLGFPAGPIYVTDLDRPIVVEGSTYSPATVLSSISGLGDNLDGKPRRIAVGLSGLDPVLRARVLAARIAFGAARVRLAFCDRDWKLLDTPVTLGVAVLSQAEADYDEGSGDLEISMEATSILLRRDARQLVSHESQQLRFPGDTAMIRVSKIASYQINWGGVQALPVAPSTVSGAGGSRSSNTPRGTSTRELIR